MQNGRCKMHGGKSLTGIASPVLASGRYSKNLPTRMMGRYAESRQESDQLALREDIALIDARLEDMLAKVDTGESGETWKALQESVHAFDAAERKANYATTPDTRDRWKTEREEAMRTIIVLCQEGMADYAAWNEIKSLLEQRRKVSETEQKRLVAMQQMITAEQAMLMQSQVLDIIRRNVTDRSTLAAIASDFRSLAVAGHGRPD